MQAIDTVILGDYSVGKSSMIRTYTTNVPPGTPSIYDQYSTPFQFDNHIIDVSVNGKTEKLQIW